MASKRRQRKAFERSKSKTQGEQVATASPMQRDGFAKTSVADLIFMRHKNLSNLETKPASIIPDKPAIQAPTILEKTKLTENLVREEGLPTPPKAPEKNSEQIASDHQKELILRAAKENQAYYQSKTELSNYKTPWFKFPKQPLQYSEFVMVSPEMAAIMLEYLWKREEGNRLVKPMLVEVYKRDMLNNHWIPTDEGISIDLNGEVFNGQHRLTAIVESNNSYPMYITWNVLPNAKFVVDSGAKRNINEKLALVVDMPLGNRTTSVCRAMMRGTSMGKMKRFSETEIAEFAIKYQHVLNWLCTNLPACRAEVQAAVGKAYLWYGEEKLKDFCERFRTIAFYEGDPAKALFMSMNQSKGAKHEVTRDYKKTLQAIFCLLSGKEIFKLYPRDEDIFEWLPDWEIPHKQ